MQNATSTQVVQGASAVLAVAGLLCYLREGDSTSPNLTAKEIEAQIGSWFSSRQGWALFTTPALPLGPAISIQQAEKFCGSSDLRLTRHPHNGMGSNGWATLLSFIRPDTAPSAPAVSFDPVAAWSHVPLAPLSLQDGKLCVPISRATLMTLFTLTNARCIFTYSSAAGHRAAYPSYAGQWAVTWPIREQCIVTFAGHDGQNAMKDVYPPSFPLRAGKCVEMLAGIAGDDKGWKAAFPGRAKRQGPWVLQERKRGFPGAHGSRHLYTMAGGKTAEVDFLALAPAGDFSVSTEDLKLEVQCSAPGIDMATIIVKKHEQDLLRRALDCLPWTHLSWSMHRGMRDILLAYGTGVMNSYREDLAGVMRDTIRDKEGALIEAGWNPEFVRTSMADMASSSVMFGRGNSGDLVRIVAGLVDVLVDVSSDGKAINKDQTSFWRSSERPEKLDLDGIVALTKFFVLEWSQELDYQLYHQLPATVYLS
ncbi:hypothetical protein O988_05970 [Pseudogymnoascus sp. VKM F-3808]|nr:hypothetical protein O988_05970 [Pseudogymnoascus sp. VKM F-3808]